MHFYQYGRLPLCALVLRDGDSQTLRAFVKAGADVNLAQQVRNEGREMNGKRARVGLRQT